MKKGDIIKFGNYYKSPIEWLVLDVKGNEVLLISRYGLECKPYHYGGIYISWEACELRKWLNNDFIKSAFSEEEAKKIKVSELKNEDNPKFGTRGGNDTRDRIFCLSIAEAKRYFRKDNDRQCQPTASTYSYARSSHRYSRGHRYIYVDGWWSSDINSCSCYWWLRSPGNNRKYATYVDSYGWFNLYGHSIHSAFHVVRPALRIIFDETLKQRYRREEEERRQREEQERQERRQREEQERKQREEQERRQREEQERRQKELLAQAHEEFSAIIKKGMIIPFGAYPQDNDCFRTPIEWLVLDVKGNEALLISRYGLVCKQYHSRGAITWEDCDLRKWLNRDFLKSAFSNEESERILVSKLKNDNNPKYYGTTGGNDTKDRIFCLSIAEAKQYFGNNKDRKCKPTAYVRKRAVYVNNGCCSWWLRSPGDDQDLASYVYTGGALYLDNGVNYGNIAVRPALRIILDNEHEQKQREEQERRQREEQERKQREEQERRQREELKRKQQEELERKQREELERKQREELERKQHEELERKQREELERRQLKELQAQTYKDFLTIIKTEIRKGMIIPFGSYPQNENSSRVPIEWIVLDVRKPSLTNRLFNRDNKIEALLVSRYGLDSMPYNDDRTVVTWEDCDLRKWLNNDFIKSAFSEEEVKRIKFSELKNEDNHEYGTKGGNDTKDRIFCLSITEAKQYFSSEKDRQCRPTAYARNKGAYVNNSNSCCAWWLRSPRFYQYDAAHVDSVGALDLRGYYVHDGRNAVRPALWIICNL